MPVFIQDTGTASSGRKQCADFKMQATGTGASGRVDVARIYCQVEGTGSAGRKLVWERGSGSGNFGIDDILVPNAGNGGNFDGNYHSHNSGYALSFQVDLVYGGGYVSLIQTGYTAHASNKLGGEVGGSWSIQSDSAVLHFAIYTATTTGSGTLSFSFGGNPSVPVLKYEYSCPGSNLHRITLKTPQDQLIGIWTYDVSDYTWDIFKVRRGWQKHGK